MGRGRTAAVVVAGLAALALPSAATGTPPSTGGATPGASEPAPAPELGPPPPGIVFHRPATLRRVRCVRGCDATGSAAPGARLRLRGRHLRRTDLVAFLGAEGAADDVVTKPLRRRHRAVDVAVPLGAVSGPVTVGDRDGRRADPAPVPVTVGADDSAPTTFAASTGIDVQVASPRGFFDSAVPPHVTYVVHATQPAAVTIDVIRAHSGAVVTSWSAGTVAPETPQTASWDGMVDGHLQRPGRYAFRVSARAPGAAQAMTSQAPVPPHDGDPASFVFLRNVFPVRGPHGYGSAIARFGGARHHQGQDVFAACGTPIVAARGGRVRFRQYQSRAGNYVVIDGARTGVDYAYMHLREPAVVKEGERVRTGQLIGHVGDTGDAEGCHLHLELWSAPGWYRGGSPFDPLRPLRHWDRRS